MLRSTTQIPIRSGKRLRSQEVASETIKNLALFTIRNISKTQRTANIFALSIFYFRSEDLQDNRHFAANFYHCLFLEVIHRTIWSAFVLGEKEKTELLSNIYR